MKEIALSDSLKKALQEGRKSTMVEGILQDQMRTWIKNLPPLPPGWIYEFIPGEPKYNPETRCYETTMEAKPRQKYIIEDNMPPNEIIKQETR